MNLIKLWICALVALATFNLNVLAQRQKEPGKPQLTEEERSLQAEGKKEKARPGKPSAKKPSAKPGRPSPIKRGEISHSVQSVQRDPNSRKNLRPRWKPTKRKVRLYALN